MKHHTLLLILLVASRYCLGHLTGHVVYPSDPGYRNAVAEWMGAAPHNHPKVIVFCSSVDDVVNAVDYAIDQNLTVSARSGRCDYEALSVVGNGIVIDVSPMRDCVIHTDNTVEFGAGISVIELYKNANNLLLPLSTGAIIGATGLILGGGYGFYSRAYGMASDNVISIQVVLPDANIVIANETGKYSELFWALRGGGAGTMGIVTRIVMQGYRTEASVFALSWPQDQASSIFAEWEKFAPNCTEKLTMQLLLDVGGGIRAQGTFLGPSSLVSSLIPSAMLANSTWTTPPTDKPIIDANLFWANCGDTIEQCLKTVMDGPDPNKPVLNKAKSVYFDSPLPESIRDDLIAYLAKKPQECPDGWSGVLFDPYGAAINDVPLNATAFAHRSMLYHGQFLIYWSNDEHVAEIAECRRSYIRGAVDIIWNSSAQRSYRDYADLDLENPSLAYYGDNLMGLCDAKEIYDPTELFAGPMSLSCHSISSNSSSKSS